MSFAPTGRLIGVIIMSEPSPFEVQSRPSLTSLGSSPSSKGKKTLLIGDNLSNVASRIRLFIYIKGIEGDFDLRTPASSWPVALLANPTHEQLPFETQEQIDAALVRYFDELFGSGDHVSAGKTTLAAWLDYFPALLGWRTAKVFSPT